MTPSEILAEEMEAIKIDLIAKHRELGMPASGKWIESVEANTNRLSGVILAEHYTEQLVNGRAPGRFPPIDRIEQWIKDKGIQPIDANLKISSLAFLIARKIAREGTRYFQEGGTDLVEAVITPARIQRIINRVTEFQINSFTSDITGMFQKLAA
ncbi:hypothetical protein [Xanthomarina gelatinilytica]|uniref:hypothetical protein n=1 Tax=Xanthomarina gelatinilytica TaxID=1137281 RepID=UPI003AA8B9AC